MAHKILYSCPYCGRIHDRDYECAEKTPKRVFKRPVEDRRETQFHHSHAWHKKANQIRYRDKNLCRACLAELPGTYRQLNYYRLSVHHIVPLVEDWDRRLDDSNLITLCPIHHEMAESGRLPRRKLFRLASTKPNLNFE